MTTPATIYALYLAAYARGEVCRDTGADIVITRALDARCQAIAEDGGYMDVALYDGACILAENAMRAGFNGDTPLTIEQSRAAFVQAERAGLRSYFA